MALSELGRRWIVASVGIPLAVLLVYAGGWTLAALLAAVAALGARELYRLAQRGDVAPLGWLGVPAAAFLVLLAAPDPTFPAVAFLSWILVVCLVAGALAVTIWVRGPEGEPLASAAVTVAGVLYTGGTLSFGVLLRHLVPPGTEAAALSPWSGTLLFCWVLAVTWAGDSAAYFAGRRWGRAKLLPRVSPGKTVVGGVAGLAGSVAMGALWAGFGAPWLAPFGLSPWAGGLLGGVLGFLAQVGDLTESVLKREAGVKDSGAILPGHGGILDRFDALFFTIPGGYVLVRLLELVA